MEDGEIVTKLKTRTFRKGIRSLQQLTEECGNLEKAAILYTTDSTEANNLSERLGNSFCDDSKPWVLRISPAVGAHGGPGLVGSVCVTAKD